MKDKELKKGQIKCRKTNNLGITLVALVVTIIVLLILAAVSFSLVLGNNGIVTKAGSAGEATENAMVMEAIKLKVTEIQSDAMEGKYKTGLELQKLRENNYIDNNDVVNISLIASNNKKGKGDSTALKDVYTIELNDTEYDLMYYDTKGTVKNIGYLFSKVFEPTDATYFDFNTSTGTVALNGTGSDLEDIVIPSQINGVTVTKIGEYKDGKVVGINSTKVRTIYIPDTVTEILTDANTANNYGIFNGCTSLRSVVLSNNIKTLPIRAFTNCSSLKKITIPSGVTSIGSETFSGCTSLTTVNIPEGVKTISDKLFYNCTSLSTITIPSSATILDHEAFSGCTGLTSFTIPASVTGLGYQVFANCTGISNMTVPSTVIKTSYEIFSGWTASQKISVPFQSGSVPSTWDSKWKDGCNANIIYQ